MSSYLLYSIAMPETYTDPSTCRLCSNSGAKLCSKCKAVSYCRVECQKKDWTRHKRNCVPVVVKDLEGEGRGLVATKDLKIGDLIIKESAVIALPEDTDMWEAGGVLVEQVEKLSVEQQKEFYKLTYKQRLLDISDTFLKAAGDDVEKKNKSRMVTKNIKETAIFFNNDIATEDGYKCLFPNLALTNHSCSPNSSWSGTRQHPRQLELRAIKDIEEGEEVFVNYIVVEGRFSDKESRQKRLKDGWEFDCQCNECQGCIEENIKQSVREMQEEMVAECDSSLDKIDWARLAKIQARIIQQVGQLSCAPVLLHREYQSGVHLAHLARDNNMVEDFMEEWKVMVDKINITRALADYNSVLNKLEEWKQNLKKKLPPHEKEVKEFLWLM